MYKRQNWCTYRLIPRVILQVMMESVLKRKSKDIGVDQYWSQDIDFYIYLKNNEHLKYISKRKKKQMNVTPFPIVNFLFLIVIFRWLLHSWRTFVRFFGRFLCMFLQWRYNEHCISLVNIVNGSYDKCYCMNVRF